MLSRLAVECWFKLVQLSVSYSLSRDEVMLIMCPLTETSKNFFKLR